MNMFHPARRRRFQIGAAGPAVLLVALTLLSACGSSSSSTGTEPVAGKGGAAEQARRYAQCMRGNGVPGFPDPDANGQFRGQSHELQGNPKFQAALQACRALAPGGTHEQSVGSPAFVEQARKFAQCIRDNGVPGFPDPGPDGTFRGQSHELQGDPKFEAALQTCRSKLPGGGAHQGP
jgi:hypothetical protein